MDSARLLRQMNNILFSLLTVPDPALRQPITLSAVAPLFICYYVLAFLVQLPRTFALKLSLLPIVFWTAWDTATRYDLAMQIMLVVGTEDYDSFRAWNYALVTLMFYIPLRAMEFTFASEPYRRLSLSESKMSEYQCNDNGSRGLYKLLQDALELTFNQRGLGWSWSRNPFPDLPSHSLTNLARSLLLRIMTVGIAFFCARYSHPVVDGAQGGVTIFDPSLPPLKRYACAVYTTLIVGTVGYCAIDIAYLSAAVIACTLLGYSPFHWPPPTNRPWLSTSIADFWGNRWHRFICRVLCAVGSKPLIPVFGRPGAVMGAFILSAIFHDWSMYGLGRGTEFRTVGMFFVMMGIGALLEGVWESWLTMGKVKGWKGWAWTMVWTVGWGAGLVDAWVRKGLVTTLLPRAIR